MARRYRIVLVVVSLGLPLSLSCGTEPSPVVTGCGTVSYQGKSWTISGSGYGCGLGASSLRSEISGSGGSACFEATCSRGCLASAVVCD